MQAYGPAASPRFGGKDVTATRGGRVLFSDLHFSLATGGALILTGPNGSGKSTLLRLMAGFGRPLIGGFLWGEEPVARDLDRHRARLHYLGHSEAIRPALTVAETLTFWQSLSGRPRSASSDRDAALDAFGVLHLASLGCRFLSAGQRRRLTLARLLAWQAPLWLLDEPTVGLDRDGLALLVRAIEAHRATGGIVILSTHQILELADAQTLELTDFPPTALSSAPDAEW